MVRLVVGGADGTAAALLFERETEWAAPSILMSELHNVLVGFVRRGTVTSEQAKAMSDDAAVVLGNRIASVSGHQVIDVALECGLTAYDAEFVALARALGVPLVTLDNAVLAARTIVKRAGARAFLWLLWTMRSCTAPQTRVFAGLLRSHRDRRMPPRQCRRGFSLAGDS